MAQDISDTNSFTTNYEVGVPLQTDVANIVQAFTEYHYGADYDGTGSPAGMEGHLSGPCFGSYYSWHGYHRSSWSWCR